LAGQGAWVLNEKGLVALPDLVGDRVVRSPEIA
jgi:hypothetical protein